MELNATAEARFWPKVDRRGPEECWPWLARRDKNGYGKFRPAGAQSSDAGAHRVAFVLAGGRLDDGFIVMHTCDNPPCCNPLHLRVGTHAENITDRETKGRGRHWPGARATGSRNGKHTHPESRARGELNGWSRFTADDVRAMRAAYAAGESQTAIAERFDTAQPVVSRIVRRTAWAHIE